MNSLYASIPGLSNIVSVNVTTSHSASVSTAIIECLGYSKNIGDLITVDIGYTTNHAKVFTGYIKQIERRVPGDTWTVTAHDVMCRAVDYFFVSSTPDNPFTRQNIQAEDLIQDVLEMAGLVSFDMDNTSFTFATTIPAEVNLVSAYDYSKSLADLLAWHLWADENGTINFKNRKPFVMTSGPPRNLQTQPGFNADSSIKTLTDANPYDFIIFDKRLVEKDLRNRIVVYGTPGITAIESSATSYNPDTDSYEQVLPNDFYKSAAASSVIIDNQTMANKAADYNLKLYNRLLSQCTVSVIGDPDLIARKVVTVNETVTGTTGDFYIFHAQHAWDQNGYRVEMELTR